MSEYRWYILLIFLSQMEFPSAWLMKLIDQSSVPGIKHDTSRYIITTRLHDIINFNERYTNSILVFFMIDDSYAYPNGYQNLYLQFYFLF